MSQDRKPGHGDSTSAPPSPAVHPKELERIKGLLVAGNAARAVEFAKDLHKRCKSAESEALLLDTYGARFQDLLARNLERDAVALIGMVRERYPSARERLTEWNAALAAHRGDLSGLLAPLADPSLAAAKHAEISALVRRKARDLRALAECSTLPAEHPLRTAAAALWKAFEAVTSGPVAEEALALPEVSRSSPLAPWKMLVRAMAAWYRRDDGLCEKYLAAVEAGSAAARLVPPLRAMMQQRQMMTPAAAALVGKTGGDLEALRLQLKNLDSVFQRRERKQILTEVREAVSACRTAAPDVLERLRQHISIRALVADLKPDAVAAALGGPSLKNAYFWRLYAHAIERADSENPLVWACAAWAEFRKHAVREGWFGETGPGIAALYGYMADLLRRVDPDELPEVRDAYLLRFDFFRQDYRDQPPEIRALMSERSIPNLYFLWPEQLLERACDADPTAENFERWLKYVREDSAPALADGVAERWSAASPSDIRPLLHLMQSAEERNALKLAFGYMEKAERIDGLNSEVRRARLRLLVSITVRHLREKKYHLAEKDLRQMEALPQAQQGDRPAMLAALRFVWRHGTRQEPAAAAEFAEAVRLLGDAPTAHLLFLEVERWCKCKGSRLGSAPEPTGPFATVFGRVCALGEDMGMRLEFVSRMPQLIMRELQEPNFKSDPKYLAALGEVAMRADYFPLAYVIAGAGLAQGSERQAAFLFLRAQALPPWEEDRRGLCVAAASELARRQHDAGLLQRIGEWRMESLAWLDAPGQAETAMDSEEIANVVQGEIKAPLPTGPPQLDDDDGCQCPDCCAARGELPNDLPAELIEMMEELGPEAVARALAEMIGIGGKKKRRRRHARLNDDDTPF